ncbi:hypothetical protein OsJ_19124 [Oryza sativa Japonica Group]|uniref:Uncharacterized protein n=1 Tax=Oryza sativa subsp. japonica TaxID=39947 RepID=B9FL09_ORYSJ|nr:hypothetical protein OsJ_19124 [Oryza sativa Japonica Group]
MSMLDVGDGVGRAQPVGDEDLARGHTEPGPEDIGVQVFIHSAQTLSIFVFNNLVWGWVANPNFE